MKHSSIQIEEVINLFIRKSECNNDEKYFHKNLECSTLKYIVNADPFKVFLLFYIVRRTLKNFVFNFWGIREGINSDRQNCWRKSIANFKKLNTFVNRPRKNRIHKRWSTAQMRELDKKKKNCMNNKIWSNNRKKRRRERKRRRTKKKKWDKRNNSNV